ncbi:MAG: ABC transporter permease subunit [Leptospiraceae bacterium]|nr:ABC transporter permease subunit [Leptospiraceae bacterium]
MPIRQIFIITGKETVIFYSLRSSWVILAAITMLNGLAGWWALHQEPVVNRALQMIFYFFSGTTMISSVLYGMRAIAEEKNTGTLELLLTSPISEYQIVLGKFFANLGFLSAQLLVSLPIVFFAIQYGNGSIGQVIAGYIGLMVLAGGCTSLMMFYSSIAPSQIFAAALGGANIVIFLLMGFFSPYLSPPLKNIIREFSFYVRFSDFEKGAIVIRHIIFFLSICILYLYSASMVLTSRYWSKNR